MTISRSELSERPVFEPDEPRIWPFGGKAVRGRLLTSFTTDQLLAMRREVERKNRAETLDWLLLQIDDVLEERGGE